MRKALVLALCLLSPGTSRARDLDPVTRDAVSRVDIGRAATHVQFLGRDVLMGRSPGTEGAEIAARYISDRLHEIGLVPAGDGGTFHQQVPLHGSQPSRESRLTITTRDGSVDLELWDDYLLYATGDQTSVARPIPVVFAGYGITAPEFDYDDYLSIDVDGAVAVFLTGEPRSDDPSYFEGATATIHSSPGVKQRLALSRGAKGSILLPSPASLEARGWDRWRRDFSFEHLTLAYGWSENLNILLNPGVADLLFQGAAFGFEDVCAMDSAGEMRSFELKTRAGFRGDFHERDFQSPNIAALLPGCDPLLENSYLVISAHYDHLGVGVPVRGDSIYNGVVDNASGVAAVLEMARVFSQLEPGPGRSILFLFVTAEEAGLLGSRYYCDHPLVPLGKTVANLNVDGLAFLDTFDSVIGVGAEFTTLSRRLDEAAGALGLRVSPLPGGLSVREEFAHSDQYAFAEAGVPSILIQEGLDFRHVLPEEAVRRLLEWGRDVYHSPFDDLDQEINMAAGQEHLEVLTAMAGSLAQTHEVPQWMPGLGFSVARMRTLIEGR